MKIIAKNRRARYDFYVLDTWEAGIKLLGLEVKALRVGNASIVEAWIKLTQTGASLVGASITPKNIPKWQEYYPTRDRALLLHKRELRKLKSAVQKGFTIIPLKIYFNSRNLAKIEIATAKGKKKYDKRRAIYEKDAKRKGF